MRVAFRKSSRSRICTRSYRLRSFTMSRSVVAFCPQLGGGCVGRRDVSVPSERAGERSGCKIIPGLPIYVTLMKILHKFYISKILFCSNRLTKFFPSYIITPARCKGVKHKVTGRGELMRTNVRTIGRLTEADCPPFNIAAMRNTRIRE